jgi:hypothetical protein
MTTINLRSTSTLTNYVKTCDRIATHARQLEQLRREEARLRPEVLAEIGERREIAVRGQVRILTRDVKESVSRACTDEEIVAFCRAHGLKYSERSPEYVAPASFSKYYREGLLLPEHYEVEVTPIVVVT